MKQTHVISQNSLENLNEQVEHDRGLHEQNVAYWIPPYSVEGAAVSARGGLARQLRVVLHERLVILDKSIAQFTLHHRSDFLKQLLVYAARVVTDADHVNYHAPSLELLRGA